MLLFLILLILAAAVLEKWSVSNALRGITAFQKAENTVIEPGQDAVLITTVENRSPRLHLFVRIAAPDQSGSTTTYLMPWQRCETRFTVPLEKRGRYRYNDLLLSGGDFLGLSEMKLNFPQFLEVVVRPARLNDDRIFHALGGFFGDHSVKRHTQEDPVLTLGIREYTGREPMKMISWNRSAQLGQLMVNNYDYTVEQTVDVVFNAFTPSVDTVSEQKFEDCCSLTRDVCEWLCKKKLRYRFRTNVISAGSVNIFEHLLDGMGEGHLDTILEGLGRAVFSSACRVSTLFKRLKADAQRDRDIIFITPYVDGEIRSCIRELETVSSCRILVLTPPDKEGEET